MGPDGRLLVQLGKVREGQIEIDCVLPGIKMREGDTPSDTMQRIVDGRLAPLAKGIHHESIQPEFEWKHSSEYGVKTKYLKSVHHASFDTSSDVPRLVTAELKERDVAPEGMQSFALEGMQSLNTLGSFMGFS